MLSNRTNRELYKPTQRLGSTSPRDGRTPRRLWAAGLLAALLLACSGDESKGDGQRDAGTSTGGAAGMASGGAAGTDASGGNAAGGAGNSAGAAGMPTDAGADAAGAAGSSGAAGAAGSSGAAGAAGSSGAAGAAGANPVIATGQNQPTGIALSATEIYWANQGEGTIVKCPKAGCGMAQPTVVTSGHRGVQGLALHGSTLYWTTRFAVDGGVGSEVMKCDVAACGSGVAAEPNPGALGLYGPFGIAVNEAQVYVAAWTQLSSCPVAGCGMAAPSSLAFSAGISDVALTASDMYLIRRGGSNVVACPLAGCSGSEPALVSNIRAALALAVDDANLYWSHYQYIGTTELGGAIRSCALGGCDIASARLVVAGQVGPAGIAVEGSDLYYTDHMNGRVLRTPKTSSSDACAATYYLGCGSCGGVTLCDGSCTVATPPNYGAACGSCGGTITCDGVCSIDICP